MSIAPVLEINGSLASKELLGRLVHLSVDRGINLVGRARLRFVEAGLDLSTLSSFGLGTEVTLKMRDGHELLSGEVTAVSVDQATGAIGGNVTELTVTVDDKAHRLGTETRNRSFLKHKLSAVMSTIAQEASLMANVAATEEVFEYLLQAGTNLAYLDWAAARTGRVWYVDQAKLNVVEAGTSANSASMELGEQLLRFSARASGRHTGKVTVTGWDDAQQAAVKHVASTTTTQESDLVAKYPGRTSATGAGIAVADVGVHTANEAKSLSEALLQESTSAAVQARGTCLANGAIGPTTKVTVANAGPASGTYLVTRVEHVYDASGFFTHFTAGPTRPDGLVDLLGGSRPSPGMEVNTLVPAVVTNLDDPDGLGRAKVQFTTMNGDIESWWARIVTPGAGKTRGIVFQPEVGDEVIVGFEQGDTRRPVILGGVFSESRGLPTKDNVASGEVVYRRITSRNGHVVELADGASPDKSHVLLKVGKTEHSIRVGQDKIEVKTANKPISITNGKAKIEFSDSGDITIQGVNITIKADGALKLQAAAGVEIKSDSTAKLEATIVNVKAQGTGTVEAAGSLALKGGTVAIN